MSSRRPRPVDNLIPGFHTTTPLEDLQETLAYTTSPQDYLRKHRRLDLMSHRAHLIHIPPAIDRDMYGRGAHKQAFEAHIAALLGKTHGLFFITGVQAQLTAIKLHCLRVGRNRVAWHARCHLEIAEEQGYREVFGLQRTLLGKWKGELPTVEDVRALVALPVEERPAVVLLELPNRELGCRTYAYEDLLKISVLCREAGVRLHMDGARLWEIEPYYEGRSFANIAALFDSVYVSFYKGLTGACGAMLLSSDESFFDDAKKWQRRLGGNMVTSYNEVIDSERGFNLNIGTFYIKWQKMAAVALAVKNATQQYRTKDGKPFVYFSPEVPTCCQVRTYVQGVPVELLCAARDEVERKHHIRAFAGTPHPWVDPDLEEGSEWTFVDDEGEVRERHIFMIEWWIGNENLRIGTDVFAVGWNALCHELNNALQV